MNPKRKYISIYLKDAACDDRKKGYLTISFDSNSLLYKKCKALGSTKVKKLIGIKSYTDLVEKAKAKDRALGNYIKYLF